jgi:bifunctional enzyme CysN/CysC
VTARAPSDTDEGSPEAADQFEAEVTWMDEHDLVPGRPYTFELGAETATAQVTRLKHRIDVETDEHLAARTLARGEVGVVNLSLDRRIGFAGDGADFVLRDRATGCTVATGALHFALRRATNVHWQALEVTKAAHVALNGHQPAVVWFTGLSGAGKSTIANLVERRLHALGVRTCLLDGDNVRHGLSVDLGFTEADRVENIRRVAEVAKLMVGCGLVVIVSLISPFRSEREMARGLVEQGEFFEIFVATPLAVAEERDPKGLYRKARSGELPGFTGIDSPYEPPAAPELRLDTTSVEPVDAAAAVVEMLEAAGVLGVRAVAGP